MEVFMSDVAPTAKAGHTSLKRSASSSAGYIFWIMFFINLLNFMDRYIFVGASNVIARELGMNIGQVGYIASAFLIVYTLATLPLGAWADRTKRKNVIAISVAVWSLATALTALTGNFITFFLSRMVLGIGEAGYYPAGTAMLSDTFSRTRRAQIMSRWGAGSVIGLMLGFVIGGVVAGLGYGDWRLAFVFTGIPGLVLAFLAWKIREPRRNQADDEDALALDPTLSLPESERSSAAPEIVVPRNVVGQFTTLLRIKTVVVLIVMQVFAFFVLGASVTFLPIYIQQKDILGLSSGLASILSGGVVVVAGFIGLILGGYMSDILSRRYPGGRVLVCGIGFLLSAPAFALTVTFHSEVLFITFFFITTLLLYIYNGPSTAATQDVVPAILRASAAAITLLMAHLLGDAFSPSIVGTLALAFDPTHGQHFAHQVAGQDLSLALLVTCVPALIIAGLVGIFGARWMKNDVAAAQHTDHLTRTGQLL
jgi:MFS family permease